MLRVLIALLATLLLPVAWGQIVTGQIAKDQAVSPRGSQPARPISPQQLLAELRGGGNVLYLRHVATDFSQNDDKMRDFDDCANQRNLVDRGRADGRRIGAAIRELGIPIGRVLASPYCRTMETARVIFGRAEKMLEVRGGPVAAANAERYIGLRRLMTTTPDGGGNLVISSHGNPFQAVAGAPYLAEGEIAVVRPLGNNFEIIARLRIEDWSDLVSAARIR